MYQPDNNQPPAVGQPFIWKLFKSYPSSALIFKNDGPGSDSFYILYKKTAPIIVSNLTR